MCVLYVSFGFKVRPRIFGFVGMGSEVCFFHFAGSGVNRVQVILSGFSVKLLCFVQAKCLIILYNVVCISWLYLCLCM